MKKIHFDVETDGFYGAYWECPTQSEAKKGGDMLNSRKLFDDSEAAHPLTEEEMIKVENIKGKLFAVAAEDDVLWDTAKYVRRMQARLSEKPHDCETIDRISMASSKELPCVARSFRSGN